MSKSNFIFTILFVILAIIISLIFLGISGVEKIGSINLGQSRSKILSRCLEKGYQDFKIAENKIYCVQKEEETLILD